MWGIGISRDHSPVFFYGLNRILQRLLKIHRRVLSLPTPYGDCLHLSDCIPPNLKCVSFTNCSQGNISIKAQWKGFMYLKSLLARLICPYKIFLVSPSIKILS